MLRWGDIYSLSTRTIPGAVDWRRHCPAVPVDKGGESQSLELTVGNGRLIE